MAIVGLAAVVLVALAGAAWFVRRRTAEDVHSVDDYRHTLSTLQTIRTKTESTSVRVIEPPGAARSTAGGAAAQGVTAGGEDARSVDERPLAIGSAVGSGGAAAGSATAWGTRGAGGAAGADTDTPPGGLRFDDVRSASATVTPPTSRAATRGRRNDRAMSVMNHGPRRLGGPVAAGVLVIALIVTLLVVGAHTRHRHPPAHTTTTTAGATATTSATRGRAGSAAGKGSRKATTTTTTEPAQFAPVSTSAQGATYTPPAAQYSLVVSTTTGRCWVQVRSVSSGSTLFAQTLDAGAQQEISANGGVTVLLGAPTVATVTVDGTPVVLPSVAVAPLVLTFTPAASTAGSPTTTSPTTTSPNTTSPNTASPTT